jgi:hypothetical protein
MNSGRALVTRALFLLGKSLDMYMCVMGMLESRAGRRMEGQGIVKKRPHSNKLKPRSPM